MGGFRATGCRSFAGDVVILIERLVAAKCISTVEKVMSLES